MDFDMPLDEFAQNELYNQTKENFEKMLRENKEAQAEYEQTISAKGPQLMVLQLSNMKYAIEDKMLNMLTERINNLYTESESIDLMKKLIESCDTEHINTSLMVAFALAENDLVKNKNVQNYLMENMNKVQQKYAEAGFMKFGGFLLNLILMEHWVEELMLKEKVYTEITELEKTPIEDK